MVILKTFVILGTQDKAFPRLLKDVEASSLEGEILAQSGFTAYSSEKMKVVDYLGQEDFQQAIKEADLVITHGGVGTIMQALSFGKKVIAAPRYGRYGEHQNDHQADIVESFAAKGYLLPYYDGDDLNEVLKKAEDFVPQPFQGNHEHFLQELKNYLIKVL